jgi:peptide/nickel transport system permease protein
VGRLTAFIIRRTLRALALIVVVASIALVFGRLAPGDHLSAFEADPAFAAAERHRLGLDRPLHHQYFAWLAGAVRLDLGESTAFEGRTVMGLVAERAGPTALIGFTALALATLLGVPAGIISGTRRRGALAWSIRAVTIVALSVPPIVLSLSLLLVASRTGWFPTGGFPVGDRFGETVRFMVLPVLALALPIGAALERLQSRAIAEALRNPSILAARARGVPSRRLIWRHALRLSLKPVLAVYGITIGALISGSFVVEYVMTWPGLGRLMYEAIITRDTNLVAGCAAASTAFLSFGILISDVLLSMVDPRLDLTR